MNLKNNKRIPWILPGFGIGVLISVLSWFGISGLLSVIKNSKLPEEELIIFTSLFYGIVFFIALGGVRAESRRNKLLISRSLYGNVTPTPSGAKVTFNRIKTILWCVFCVFSLGWLTPALVIYWAAPKHPEWAMAVCGCLFSLLAGTFLSKGMRGMKTLYNYLMFFIGVVSGIFLVTGGIISNWLQS